MRTSAVAGDVVPRFCSPMICVMSENRTVGQQFTRIPSKTGNQQTLQKYLSHPAETPNRIKPIPFDGIFCLAEPARRTACAALLYGMNYKRKSFNLS